MNHRAGSAGRHDLQGPSVDCNLDADVFHAERAIISLSGGNGKPETAM